MCPQHFSDPSENLTHPWSPSPRNSISQKLSPTEVESALTRSPHFGWLPLSWAQSSVGLRAASQPLIDLVFPLWQIFVCSLPWEKNKRGKKLDPIFGLVCDGNQSIFLRVNGFLSCLLCRSPRIFAEKKFAGSKLGKRLRPDFRRGCCSTRGEVQPRTSLMMCSLQGQNERGRKRRGKRRKKNRARTKEERLWILIVKRKRPRKALSELKWGGKLVMSNSLARRLAESSIESFRFREPFFPHSEIGNGFTSSNRAIKDRVRP